VAKSHLISEDFPAFFRLTEYGGDSDLFFSLADKNSANNLAIGAG